MAAHGQAENRAYVALYAAEQIINWRVERVQGRNVLTLVVLRGEGGGRKRTESDEVDEFERSWWSRFGC